jgi:integrase
MQTEVSPSQAYRIDTINKLKYFAEKNNPKSFRDITRQDIVNFLEGCKKSEIIDPLHKSTGTHENYRVALLRFFRWLYYPEVPDGQRPKPAVMDNIPKIKRKEESIYKPNDMWTEEDDFIFYRYCPSARDRCFHAVARDTGCRRGEILNMKIKDIVAQQFENGHQIARISVNGKTGVRSVRINNSYPRLKDWLSNGHPFPGVPASHIFCGTGKKNTGRRLAPHSINAMYERYQKTWFPKLLKDPLVPEEDKRVIRDMLKKKWNPHNRRHTTATEISKGLKDPVLINKYMGWSQAGKTRLKYQHYFADDSVDAMLTVMDGLMPATLGPTNKKKSLLKAKQCPNCDESNKPESKFCSKCKFILSFDAFNEAVEEKGKAAKEAEQQKKALEDRLRRMEEHLDKTNLEVNTLTQTLTKTLAASLSNAGIHVRMKKNNPKQSAKKIDDE